MKFAISSVIKGICQYLYLTSRPLDTLPSTSMTLTQGLIYKVQYTKVFLKCLYYVQYIQ